MLSQDASSILLGTAGVLGVWLVYRWLRRSGKAAGRRSRPIEDDNEVIEKLEGYLTALEKLIAIARQEAKRLEGAIEKAKSMGVAPRDTLGAIEDLADPAAMENPAAMTQVAAEIARKPAGAAERIFTDEEKTLKIASLVQRGYTAPQIARRLNLPVGEVELLLSARS
jgi:DNA-binding NarL/FixJ family response regulator